MTKLVMMRLGSRVFGTAEGSLVALCTLAAFISVPTAILLWRTKLSRKKEGAGCSAILELRRSCCNDGENSHLFSGLCCMFGYWIGAFPHKKVVRLRTARTGDAEIYRALLLPHQQQLGQRFSIVIEEDPELDTELRIEVLEYAKERKWWQSFLPSFTNGTRADKAHSGGTSTRQQESSSGCSLLLCRIKLPEVRVSRDIPRCVFPVLASYLSGHGIFSTYAEEVFPHLPLMEEMINANRDELPQKAQRDIKLSVSPYAFFTSALSYIGLSNISNKTLYCSTGNNHCSQRSSPTGSSEGDIASASQWRVERRDGVVMDILGDAIDVNATLFSTSLLVGRYNITPGGVCGAIAGKISPFSKVEDGAMHAAVDEALFNAMFSMPHTHCSNSSVKELEKNPLGVWRACRQSLLTTAKKYVLDVISSGGDPLICFSRVVDEVVSQAVLVHHNASLLEFVEVLYKRFQLLYIPHSPRLRGVIEQWKHEQCGLSDGDLPSESSQCEFNFDGPPEEDLSDIKEELPHISEFIIQNRIKLCSSVLTVSGSNQLEEVFGVPATVFPFLSCARESIAFITQVYDCFVATYGQLTLEKFTQFTSEVFKLDYIDASRQAARTFRALNKSRTGTVSFEELCHWIARKLSDDPLNRPDARLLAITTSLGLPLALVLEWRHQWLPAQCNLMSFIECVEG
uniref:EF-hand domain-containing protein n=1 Tax=Trypanosoma congolense (strain IL3000) TaxID=1068625 RepID=G0UQH5_TRYCI|nr:conserved hypothetical protein [Trypanosoma congolense IL3000]